MVLVDDEEDIVLYLQTALEDAGYDALTAGNVPEGLELIRKESPDLVCLDILMPKESGILALPKAQDRPGAREYSHSHHERIEPVQRAEGYRLSHSCRTEPSFRSRMAWPKSLSLRRSFWLRWKGLYRGTMTTTTEVPTHVHDWIGRELFQHVPSNIIVIDRDFKVVTANSSFVEVFGEAKGKYCYEVYKKRNTPCEDCMTAKTFEDGEVRISDANGIDKDGKSRSLCRPHCSGAR